jgi:hypothetical protein
VNATDVATLLPRTRPQVKLETGWWCVYYGDFRIRRFTTADEAHRFATILATNRNTETRKAS